MEPCIQLNGLTKHFGGRTVVDNLTLTVPKGAIFAFLGDNGAGKTTTIRMLVGLLAPDDGNATILGEDAWKKAVSLRHKVGYVPEKPKFYDWMSVDEIGWFTAGFHRRGYLDRYQQAIARFKLSGPAKLKTLSKGQYSKVALALALAVDPDVLILDEPTSGLDLTVRREFLESMIGLAEEGKTILISSHQVAEVERVASHVAFIANGKLLLAATLDELRQRIVRLRLRYEQREPDAAGFGKILQRNGSGKLWQAVIQDPVQTALQALENADDIFDLEQSSLGLEEVYVALLAKKEGDA